MKYDRFEQLPVWQAGIDLAVGVYARQISAIRSTGNNTPVSLFAHMSDTPAVSSVMAASRPAKFNKPSRSTGR
jgi:hypothetical protein